MRSSVPGVCFKPYSFPRNAANGHVQLNNSHTGSFTYTPKTNFTGTDSFTYGVDYGFATASGSVTIDGIVYSYQVPNNVGSDSLTLYAVADQLVIAINKSSTHYHASRAPRT